jgi:hypothetical protein
MSLLYVLFRGLSGGLAERTGPVINIQPQNIGGTPSPYGRTNNGSVGSTPQKFKHRDFEPFIVDIFIT